MFEKKQFVKSVFNITDLPKESVPEVILCGRSNVGKSSFINSLFNKKDLAKISSTPGKTRSINYYLIDEKFFIVDLPGFGYAKASKKERESWAKLIDEFLEHSKNIRIAFHLIDSRHKPTELDIKLNSLLKFKGIDYLAVLTKVDKLKQSEYVLAKKNVLESFPELNGPGRVVNYSSVKNVGRKETLRIFSELFYS